MNKIIESNFTVGQNNKLTNLIIKSFGSSWKDEFIGQMGNIIFIDTKPRQVIISSVSSQQTFKKPLFTEYLRKIDDSNFDNLLLLVSTYPDYKDITKRPSTLKNKHLDMFLKETNGWLVYNYQLENLYIMATGLDQTQATIFRKNINKKRTAAFREAKKIKIFGTTLNEVIVNRMKFDFFINPNYSKTYKLYQYLNL